MGDMVISNGGDSEQVLESVVLERGHQALIRELGADGAMKFLRSSDVLLEGTKKSHEIKPVLMTISTNEDGSILRLGFSRAISWINLDPSEVKNIIDILSNVYNHTE